MKYFTMILLAVAMFACSSDAPTSGGKKINASQLEKDIAQNMERYGLKHVSVKIHDVDPNNVELLCLPEGTSKDIAIVTASGEGILNNETRDMNYIIQFAVVDQKLYPVDPLAQKMWPQAADYMAPANFDKGKMREYHINGGTMPPITLVGKCI